MSPIFIKKRFEKSYAGGCNKGFTLVELIIVVAIIAVLSAVLAPQYLRFVEDAKRSKDLQVATTLVDAATLSIISLSSKVPPGHYVEVLWTAGADAERYNYEGLILVREPARESSFKDAGELKPLTDDAIIKAYAEEIISILGIELSKNAYITSGYSAFIGECQSDLAKEAALAFHINTSTGEIVLASWSGNGDVNKWIDLGLNVGKAE